MAATLYEPVLKCEGLMVGYSGSTVFSDLSLEVGSSEAVCIIGRNGMGKTTLLKSIMGYLPPRRGRILFLGRNITGWRTHKLYEAGIAFAPEGRGIFRQLSVSDNLRLANRHGRSALQEKDIYALLPPLKARRGLMAGRLSGGEQQVLAIGCSLLCGPRLLIIDELSEGLQPLVLGAVVEMLKDLRGSGMSLLFVEQSIDVALNLADRVYVMDKGGFAFGETSAILRQDMRQLERYMGI